MVPSIFHRYKAVRCLPVVLATFLFAGCGIQTQEPDRTAPYMQGATQANSAFYLSQMQRATDDSKTNWQLLAIRSLLKEGKTQQADTLFNQLPGDLNDAQRREQTLLDAGLKLARHDYPAAQALLNKLDPDSLEKNQQARYWKALIITSEGRPSLALLRALVAEEPLVTGADKQKNIDATWQTLTQMTQEQANALIIKANENILQGWLDLQHMWFDNRSDPQRLKAAIRDWQSRYPNNPGATLLPTQLNNIQNFNPSQATKIALLLPLNGQAAVFGRAIQQGFETAKNGGLNAAAAIGTSSETTTAPQPVPAAEPSDGTVTSPSQTSVSDLVSSAASPEEEAQPTHPGTSLQMAIAPANPSAEIKVYDTSTQPLAQVLEQAQQDGVSVVVGPLLKDHVAQLLTSNTPLNVLALNHPPSVENRANICYFALSPEDEARDAANHIWQQGRRAPLLLVPRSALGSRVISAFADEWSKLGGGTVLEQKFGSTAEMKSGINNGSGIALTGNPVSGVQQQDITIGGVTIPAPTAETPASTPSGKVDAVYIVATQKEVALIKPMIDMRAGSRSGVTLYASSRSAQGGSGTDFRLEIEGLQFSDIPLLSGENPTLMQQALAAVNNDYSLARLYAMGMDAWSLVNNFSRVRQVPDYQLAGSTGELTATHECVINRKLTWLQYQQGRIVPAG